MTEFPKWQVHRGYWQDGVRENTMMAFSNAKTLGAEMVELDVQVSRDGVPHVFHDLDLSRFFHVDKKVFQVPSEDLVGLNVPTLQEVLSSDEVPKYLNVEIKSIDIICYGSSKKICRIIEEYGAGKKILISSFNPMCLFWAKKFLPTIPRALIVGQANDLLSWKFKYSVKIAEPQFLNARYRLIDDEITRNNLLSYKLPIMVWTVNDEEKAKFYLSRGAASIISDLAPMSNL